MSASNHSSSGPSLSIQSDPGSPRSAPAGASKQRLDLLLVARNLAESQEKARRLIMAGDVLVDNQVWDKPGRMVPAQAQVRLRATLPYVSRGGVKLAAALRAFQVDVAGINVLDVGASTGGFTDCLLQHNAASVYAVDVGYGDLAWKLRSDPRVIVLERTNIRHLDALPLLAEEGQDEEGKGQPPSIGLAVIDASFISLHLVLPPTLRLLDETAHLIALIKPQFEASKERVGKGGVVRDQAVHRDVLQETMGVAHALGLTTRGLIVSPLRGPAGNVEFLGWWQKGSLSKEPHNTNLHPTHVDAMIEQALQAAHTLCAGDHATD